MSAEQNYWNTVFQKRISRRRALSAAMGAGLGYAGLSVLGCGSQNQPSSPTPTAAKGQQGATTGQPKTGGTFRSMNGEGAPWDPNLTTDGMANFKFSRVYTSLTMLPKGQNPQWDDMSILPWLAESWEQPDPTTYIFHLRKGVKFHNIAPVNGRELTSEDVKYTVNRVGDKKTGNPETRYRTEDIVSVETPDKYTVKFKLAQPVASFLIYTSGTPLVVTPHEAVEKWGDLKSPESAIGAGPWIVDKVEPGVRISYKKNPNFFLPGKPYMDALDIQIQVDPSVAAAALRTGAIDQIAFTDRTQLAGLKQSNPELVVDEFMPSLYSRITFRLDKPPFNDVRVRRAMALAIDFDGLIKSSLLGVGQRVGPMTPAMGKWFLPFEADAASAKWYNYKPDDAKKLLAEAGYANGFDTTMVGTAALGPAWVETMEMIASYLQKVGIRAKIDLKEFGAYMSTAFVGDFEGINGPFPAHGYADPDYYTWALFHPGSPSNHGNLNDPDLNKMLEKQKGEMNAAERTKTIHEITKRVRDQVYNIAIPAGPWISLMKPYVKDYWSVQGRISCFGNGGPEYIDTWLNK